MEKRLQKIYVSVVGGAVILALIFFGFKGLTGFAVFSDDDSSDFGNGIFYRTFYNSSGFIQLNISQNFLTGNYTSQIFDGVSAQWNNISFTTGTNYSMELPNNQAIESNGFARAL